jgi:succinate dehydrogenase / fumarate reductase cytochrome b subunit
MKFALFTGCVAKGATRELMLSTTKAAEGLGFDFIEMKAASCCGAGVVSEKSPLLADVLNARTFSIAEKQNLDIVTICSTCQGTLKKRSTTYSMKADTNITARQESSISPTSSLPRREWQD